MTEHDELRRINEKLQRHNEEDDRRFGEIVEVGGANNKALGRIEATLEQHGVLLVNIEDHAAITNGRVTAAEKDIDQLVDRAAVIANEKARSLDRKQRLIIGLSSGGAVSAILVVLKIVGVA